MKVFLLIIPAVILFSCKKNTITVDPTPIDLCAGRYDLDLFASVKTDLNVQYGAALNITGMQESLFLDVYQPNNDTLSKRPLIIFNHGGGWTSGTKTQGKDFCTLFSKKGYVAFSIDYRLGIENPVNDKTRGEAVYRGVQDLKAAIRFARANATIYRIDTNQIFIGGYSAGGVNAMHTAYWNENEIPLNIDRNRWGSLEGNGGNPTFASNVHLVYGIATSIVDLNWIQSNEPPVVCVHSKTDRTEPYASGLDGKGVFVYGGSSIVSKAASLNLSSSLFTFENIAHGDYLQPENFVATTTAVKSFLKTKVKCK